MNLFFCGNSMLINQLKIRIEYINNQSIISIIEKK